VAEFVCNICAKENLYSGEPFERETPSCSSCGSTLRTRALIGALSMELFGIQLTLPDFPRVKSWRGLGTSDSTRYAVRLAEVFDYRNTFYDREPRFDLGSPGEPDTYDFVLSSDVFEHVAPPADQAFRNAYTMLKPNGVLVFTVPYEIDESAEHFPDLYEYGLTDVGNRIVLVNRTRAGETQVFENLNFHRSGAGRSLEMRVFSEKTLRDVLATAGFDSVQIYAENYRPFGIVSAESWSLPVAARKGPFGCSRNAMRDVMGEWRDLKSAFKGEQKRVDRSLWCRIGRRLRVL
jgi:SAM-dependent methyltransferase